MTKCILITGCGDCAFAFCDSKAWGIYTCTHSMFTIIDNPNIELPKTPHPDCKLNDLPTVDEIEAEADDYSDIPAAKVDFHNGAGFVIARILPLSE